MSITLSTDVSGSALPVWTATHDTLGTLPDSASRWVDATNFNAAAGSVLIVADGEGRPAGAILGLGKDGGGEGAEERRSMLAGALATKLPSGCWRFCPDHGLDARCATLALILGGYRFDRYRTSRQKDEEPQIEFEAPAGVDLEETRALATSVFLTRDLISTPTNDMGPAELEAAARALADEFGASLETVEGEALLQRNFPMIHAVGRASTAAPRLIDLVFGPADAPKVTLVGKGVCFDTGGLDIKSASGMLLMKKDMGGSANVLGLARMIMARKLNVRLRVLIPAVENSIAGNSFRPGDVLTSRQGKTVEIGNTDAEGRLVLADALTLADEEGPEILIDMATLTGAARVALGGDLPALFTDDGEFADAVARAGETCADPTWRMPLWRPYEADLSSKIADTNNVSFGGLAGAITAALFLKGFVSNAKSWTHLDIYAWKAKATTTCPVGGEAYAIRAIFDVLKSRYPAS